LVDLVDATLMAAALEVDTRRISSASPSPTMRAPIDSTLASL
jgi:hypothetical protein